MLERFGGRLSTRLRVAPPSSAHDVGAMRQRHASICVAVVSAVFFVFIPATSAYYFHGYKWPGGVVRYFNAAPDQAWAVNQAVSAWNNSGAHVRFIAVPRAQAQLVITDPANKVYCSEGKASVGYVHNAHVFLFPARGRTHACNQYWAARVMAHELGHVLGLQHEDRYCAAMNAYGSLRGGKECQPSLPWAWRCRLLELNDVAGAAAMYGGAPRPVRSQPLCPLYGEMQPPQHLRAKSVDTAGVVALSFTRPSDPIIPAFAIPSPWHSRDSFVVLGPSKKCPSIDPTSDAVYQLTHWRWHAKPGAVETFTTPPVRGRNCYGVWAIDKLGRPSAAARLFVVVR